jgi:hypothetical protein
MLADLAQRFPELPTLPPIEVRFAVLGALVDGSTPCSPAFWKEILKQEPEKYALLALSGVLATDPLNEGIKLLSKMPNAKRAGQAAAIKLDLLWDGLPMQRRFKFVEKVQKILGHCGQNFAGPVIAWVEKKSSARPVDANQGLYDAIHWALGEEFLPRTHTPKLCLAACS